MYCPCCGARLPVAASFCGTCGARVEGSALGPSQPENARRRKVNKKVIIAVSVAVVLIAAVVTLSFLLGGSKTYEELIVGSWYSDELDNSVTFYYDGLCEGGGGLGTGFQMEKGEVRWEIEEDTLVFYDDYMKYKAKIETLNEKELEISLSGVTLYYERQVYEELIVGSWCKYNAAGDISYCESYYNDGTYVAGFPTNDGSIRITREGHYRIEGNDLIYYNDYYESKYTIITLNKGELAVGQNGDEGVAFERVDFDPFDP